MSEALVLATRVLRDEIRPKAIEIDQSVDAVREAFAALGRHDLLALRRPKDYGGPAIAELDFRRFQVEAARASGTFAFLQTQHQTAVGMVAKSENDSLKSSLLPFMGTGERAVGIGFSQLRRSGEPICRAEPTESGFRVHGHVPWVTGWSIFDSFVLGAALPDGQAVFGICPLPMQSSKELRVSDPMRLASMEAAQTVTVDLDGFHLTSDQVVFIQPSGWAQKNDEVNIALQGFFALGCAHAGVDLLELEPEFAAALRYEVDACQSQMEQLAVDGDADTKLKLRAWAIDLSVRCAHAAVAATGGRANSLAHDAQRVYREALVFTVSAQTPAIRHATLDRLVRQPAEFMQAFENP